MDTPAGPDPDINIGGEETGIEIRDALLGLRMEMRAMHQHLAVELDEMRKMRAAQRREFGWLVGPASSAFRPILPLSADASRAFPCGGQGVRL
jgi:hypothetical protein